ncbi:MAG: DNA alkylation repair protein [Candidatus Levybacteria bacterium]|nr:DNA alkylation repair protein [Candidatus Levybacteria bacterium]
MLKKLKIDIKKSANPKKASFLQRFFKTSEGEYGFGDVFIGLTVPKSREIAIKYKDLDFNDILTLLKSPVHEERLIALLILVHQYEKEEMLQRRIYEFYLKNTKYINNWDLVDLSSDKIVGAYLIDKPKDILVKLSKSNNLWERRIAMIATYNFIKNKMFDETLLIAENLIADENDLIQKAVGWMLREVGNRDLKKEEQFLKKYYKTMGRTALRYAIEKFPQNLRQKYLAGKI